MWKKTLALLLVLAMLVGFSGNFAFTAHAEEATTPVSVVNAVYDADGTSDYLLGQQVGDVKFGAKWDRDNLYLGFGTAITATATLNDVAFPVNGTEVTIPLAAANVLMDSYDEEYSLVITVGETSWSGNVLFDSYVGVDFASLNPTVSKFQMDYTVNTYPETTLDLSYMKSSLEDGVFKFTSKYADVVFTDGVSDITSTDLKDVITYAATAGNAILDATKPLIMEMDIKIDAMPVYADGGANLVNSNPRYRPLQGLVFGMADEKNAGSLASIINKTSGLWVVSGHTGSWTGERGVKLGKTLGEEFHLTLVRDDAEANMSVYVDGVYLGYITAPRISASGFAAGGAYVSLQNKTKKPVEDGSNDFDITVKNVTLGQKQINPTVDLTALEIPTTATSDIELPQYVPGGMLNGIAIEWTSSNPAAITADGKVTQGMEDKVVTLTATCGEQTATYDVAVPASKNTLFANSDYVYSVELSDGTKVGAKWDRDNLYLSFASAVSGTATLNGYAVAIDGTEIQIPLADAGVYLAALEEARTLSISAGEASWVGKVVFVGNTYLRAFTGSEFTLANRVTAGGLDYASITASGNSVRITRTYTEDTVKLEDLEVLSATSVQDTNVIGGATTPVVYDFDVAVDAMPVWTAPFTSGSSHIISGEFATFQGLVFTARNGDNYRFGYAIVNREVDGVAGLYMLFKDGSAKETYIDLGKQVGDSFHVRAVADWNNSMLYVYVDGVLVGSSSHNHTTTVGAVFGNAQMGFGLIDKEKTGNVDVTVSNATASRTTQEVTVAWDGIDIPDTTTTDIELPAYVPGGMLNGLPLTWTSNHAAITADGKVTQGFEAVTGTLTATYGEGEAALSQTFEVTVPASANTLFAKYGAAPTLAGQLGAAWDRNNLYLVFDKAVSGTATLNGHEFAISGTEATIALADAGILMTDYQYATNLTIAAGEDSWLGTLVFDSVDAKWGVSWTSSNAIDYMNAENIGTNNVNGGVHLTSTWSTDATIAAEGTLERVHWAYQAVAAVLQRDATAYIDFDFSAAKMPVYQTVAEAYHNNSNSMEDFEGVNINTLSCFENGVRKGFGIGIVRLPDGLHLLAKTDSSYADVKLTADWNKEHHIRLAYNYNDATLAIYLNDKCLDTVAISTTVSQGSNLKDGGFFVALTNTTMKPVEGGANDYDVTVSNITAGTVKVLDETIFDGIKLPGTAISDIELPTSIDDPMLNGKTWEITWSSNNDAITAEGKVTQPAIGENDTEVILTATCGTVTKDFTVTVPAKAAVTVNGEGNYDSLTEALAAASAGDTIDLWQNTTENVEIAKKDITLNLNNNAITGYVWVQLSNGNGAVIKNGSIVSPEDTEKTYAVYVHGRTATFENVNITATKEGVTALNASGNVTVKGNSTIRSEGGIGIDVNHKLTIEGENVSVHGKSSAISKTNGAFLGTPETDVTTIAGGTFTSETEDTVYWRPTEDIALVINGGDYTTEKGYAVRVLNGIADINGGTYNNSILIQATSSSSENIDVEIAGGTFNKGLVVLGDAIQSSLKTFNLDITGGTFLGTASIKDSGLEGYGDITVSGGTFAFDMTEYCDADHHTVDATEDEVANYVYGAHVYDQQVVGVNHIAVPATATTPAQYYVSCVCGANGTETFESGTAMVATIGDAIYGSLADAIAAAQAGQTVVLQADVAETVVIDKNITVDLNEKTVTGQIQVTETTGVIVKNGNIVATGDTAAVLVTYVQNGAKPNPTLLDLKITSEAVGVKVNGYHARVTLDGATEITAATGLSSGGMFDILGSNVKIYATDDAIYGERSWNTTLDTYSVSTIEGGYFQSAGSDFDKNAVDWYHHGTLVIKGGEFVASREVDGETKLGSAAIYQRKGQIIIENGQFEALEGLKVSPATTSYYAYADVKGGTFLGGIYVSCTNDDCANMTGFNVKISGGVVADLLTNTDAETGEILDKPGFVYEIGVLPETLQAGALEITGGTYDIDMSEYVAESAHCVDSGDLFENGDTKYVVGEHTEETIPAVEATCKEAGSTEGTKCSVCDKVLVAPEATEKLPHTEESIPAVIPTCTTPGSTVGTKCSVCGEILVAPVEIETLPHDYEYTDNGDGTHTFYCYSGEETGTVEHTFENGVCVCGAEEVTELTDPNIKFQTISLSFQEYIGLQFVAKQSVLSGYDSHYAIVVQQKPEGDETVTMVGTPSGTSKNPTYVFSRDIQAWSMTDIVTITLYGVKDGVAYKGETKTTSVEEQAYSKLASFSTNSNYAAHCKILADMLTYGAAVQVAFNHDVDDLPNAHLEELGYSSYVTSEIPEISAESTVSGTGSVEVKSTSLSLQEKVDLQLIFKNTMEAYKAVVTIDGETSEILPSGNMKKFSLVALPYKLRETYTVTICNAETGEVVSPTYTYSVESVAKTKLGNSDAFDNVVYAMMNYGDAVSAIVN